MPCHIKSCTHLEKPKRTTSQNSALHLYFQLLADELNGAGLSIQHVLAKYRVELDWDGGSVKENLWRPIQKALLGKLSTTELSKQQDIDRVYEHINRFVSQMGVHVSFPNDPDKESAKSMLSGEAVPYPTEEYQDPKL